MPFPFSPRHVGQMVKSKASKPSRVWSFRSWACGPPGPCGSKFVLSRIDTDSVPPLPCSGPSSSFFSLPFAFPQLLTPLTLSILPPLSACSPLLSFSPLFLSIIFSSPHFCLPSSSFFTFLVQSPPRSPTPTCTSYASGTEWGGRGWGTACTFMFMDYIHEPFSPLRPW